MNVERGYRSVQGLSYLEFLWYGEFRCGDSNQSVYTDHDDDRNQHREVTDIRSNLKHDKVLLIFLKLNLHISTLHIT